MATVTLGVKNQQAFPVDADRMDHHSHGTLHRRLAALYALIQPDFCIIEGLTATAHGHFPVTALLEECLLPTNVLIGGADALAGKRGYGKGRVPDTGPVFGNASVQPWGNDGEPRLDG